MVVRDKSVRIKYLNVWRNPFVCLCPLGQYNITVSSVAERLENHNVYVRLVNCEYFDFMATSESRTQVL
jgi:hypothetical protein